ncbi:uncharacterized protein G2W53_015807 [Senna tora]|uniref:Uncharacterized protein n=1 Tax=Senna tora TaxID=362788 RepID=A0A835C676_9FABA|nr:uncharacterized protein G2W53_015807 [Senna tora]
MEPSDLKRIITRSKGERGRCRREKEKKRMRAAMKIQIENYEKESITIPSGFVLRIHM